MGDETELDAIRRRAPIGGLFGEAEASATLDAATPEEGARTVSRRHEAAINSVEQSATPHETAIVERVQARLRAMEVWSADDVRDFLTEEGVPDTLAIRRRYASRCVNGIRAKRSAGKTYTRHGSRSGRLIELWENIPE